MKNYRILVPLDGSAAAEAALPEVERIAVGTAEVYLLHAVPSLSLSVGPLSAGIMQLHDQALAYLEDVRKRFPRLAGLDIIRTDEPEGAITRAAVDFDVDLIVMLTHGRDGMPHRSMGAVAGAVVQQSRLPVLLVTPGRGAPHAALRRILVALDGSEESLMILSTAGRIALLTGAKVVVLHATPRELVGIPGTPDRTLPDVRGRVEGAGHEYSQVIVDGDAVGDILAQAKLTDADLIVMSARDPLGTEAEEVGDMAQAVLRRAERAVILQGPGTCSVVPEAEEAR